MRYAESEVDMLVEDTETGRRYRIIGQRVLATDAGAVVVDLDANASGIREQGVIHWSKLEPLTSNTEDVARSCCPDRQRS